MSKVYFSTWRGEQINNLNKPVDEWEESAYKLPEQYNEHVDSKAFIGWDGVSLFNEDVDVVRLATEYAAQYQVYSEACGRCAPGRWGGRILYDLLDKIARGEGSIEDLNHLKEVSKTMQTTSKCEIGKTVPNPLLDLMEHFEDDFMNCINNQVASKHYDQEINYIAKYARTLEVDPLTGQVTKDELNLPAHAEDLQFIPPIMGINGDAFTCRDLDDVQDVTESHEIRVGKVHELLQGFDAVNCDDNTVAVKGLHLGGYYYVDGFSGQTKYLVDCLVAPEDIGAVADLRSNSEGAIRCKRYMVTGAHFKVNRAMYHPSKYAEMLDDEWSKAKIEAINNLLLEIEEIS